LCSQISARRCGEGAGAFIFSCEPAGTMHVKCEWYVARTDHGYVAQARASGAKDPLEGRHQRRKRRTICARDERKRPRRTR
jgi:hypothetical protein